MFLAGTPRAGHWLGHPSQLPGPAEGWELVETLLDALLPPSCWMTLSSMPGQEVLRQFPDELITSAKHSGMLWDEERYVSVR